MERKSYDRVLEDLQHRFYISGTDSLLDGLSYWTGCQAALIVGQGHVCEAVGSRTE